MNLEKMDWNSWVATIALTLAAYGIIDRQPLDKTINDFENAQLGYLSEITEISVEELDTFRNKTLPCLRDVNKKYGDSPNISGYDMMWGECFHSPPPTPAPTEAPIVCDESQSSATVNFVIFFNAIVILSIMTFFMQRRHRACLRCCWGFPGPVVPLNMLDSYENRKGYMLCFGITMTSVVSMIVGQQEDLLGRHLTALIASVASGKTFLNLFVKIFLTIYMASMSYPFFIAQNIHNKLIGSLLGLYLGVFWFTLEMFRLYKNVFTCFVKYEREQLGDIAIIVVFLELPKYFCLLLLIVKFIVIMVRTLKDRAEKKKKGLIRVMEWFSEDIVNGTIKRSLQTEDEKTIEEDDNETVTIWLKLGYHGNKSKQLVRTLERKRVDWLHEDDTDWRKEYMYTHVKEVFKKHRPKEESLGHLTFKEKMMSSLRSKLYEVKPGFRYSTRMVISMFSAVLAVYMMVLVISMFGYIGFEAIWKHLFTSELIESISDSSGIPLQTMRDYLNAVQVSFWIGVGASTVFYAFVVMNSLTWYRRHILRLRIGDRTFLPSAVQKGTLGAGPLMISSFKFAGFQVAYAWWGFILSFVALFLFSYIIVTQLFLPIFRWSPSLLMKFIVTLWPHVVATILMVFAQKFMVSCCFLQNADTLAVNNRRAYHIMSYFLFYFNIVLGFASCILRIGIGLMLGAIFIQRLPKSTLPRSYERKDPGYLAYIGFLMMEHQHSNPVLQCFVRLLLETQGMELRDEFFTNPQLEKENLLALMKIYLGEKDRSRAKLRKIRRLRIRNRWHLFTMLTMNPSIIKYRSHIKNINKNKIVSKKISSNSTFFCFSNCAYDEKNIIAINNKDVTGNDDEDVIALSENHYQILQKNDQTEEDKTRAVYEELESNAYEYVSVDSASIQGDVKSDGQCHTTNLNYYGDNIFTGDTNDCTPILMRRIKVSSNKDLDV